MKSLTEIEKTGRYRPMVNGKDHNNMGQLVRDLEEEAIEREEEIKRRRSKRQGKGPPRRISEDTKRMRELEIEALERREALEQKKRRDTKKEADRQKGSEQTIQDIIGKYLRE